MCCCSTSRRTTSTSRPCADGPRESAGPSCRLDGAAVELTDGAVWKRRRGNRHCGRRRSHGQGERLLDRLGGDRAVAQRKRVRCGALCCRCAGDRAGCGIEGETIRQRRRDGPRIGGRASRTGEGSGIRLIHGPGGKRGGGDCQTSRTRAAVRSATGQPQNAKARQQDCRNTKGSSFPGQHENYSRRNCDSYDNIGLG